MQTKANPRARRRPVARHPGIYYRPRPGGRVGPPYEIAYLDSTGRRRWHSRVLLRNTKTTPVVVDDVIYVSAQSGGIANQWLASVDRAETGDSDGKLSKDEVQAFVGATKVPEAFFNKTFGRGDVNKDA